MNKEMRQIRKKLNNQSGQVAVIVCLCMVAFIGMLAYVVDTGSIYESRRSFQTVADSAALAGAQELPDASDAINAATEYAEMQQIPSNLLTITVEDTLTPNDTIRVTVADTSKDMFFAGIFGINSVQVGADASAMVGSPDNYKNIVPFGVLEDDWVPGEEYTLKWGPQEDGYIHGNFGGLALGGTGANNYRKNIREGYNGDLAAGDKVDTEPGNMMGPTVQGTNDRINDYPDFTFNSFSQLSKLEDGKYKLTDNLDSQFVMCPLIDWVPFGRDEVTILAFVPFIITSISGSEVHGTFIDEALITTESEIAALDSHGIRIIRLIE